MAVKLAIVEGVAGTWHYHLRDQESMHWTALCGAQVMATQIPLSYWGKTPVDYHLPEKWCPACARLGNMGGSMTVERGFYRVRIEVPKEQLSLWRRTGAWHVTGAVSLDDGTGVWGVRVALVSTLNPQGKAEGTLTFWMLDEAPKLRDGQSLDVMAGRMKLLTATVGGGYVEEQQRL